MTSSQVCLHCEDKAAEAAARTVCQMPETKKRLGQRAWRKLISKKKKAGIKLQALENIDIHAAIPSSRRSICATSSPKRTGQGRIPNSLVEVPKSLNEDGTPYYPKEIVQRRSFDPLIEVDGLRINPVASPSNLQHQQHPTIIDRFESILPKENDELFFDPRPPTTDHAIRDMQETRGGIGQGLNSPSEHQISAAADEDAGSFIDIPEACSQMGGSTQRLSPEVQTYKPLSTTAAKKKSARSYLDLTSSPQNPGPVSFTDLIPELQGDAPNRPPIEINKLDNYLKEIAARSRPHRPLDFADDKPLFIEEHRSDSTVRKATEAMLKRTDFTATLSAEGMQLCPILTLTELTSKPYADLAPATKSSIDCMPSCVLPGQRGKKSRSMLCTRIPEDFRSSVDGIPSCLASRSVQQQTAGESSRAPMTSPESIVERMPSCLIAGPRRHITAQTQGDVKAPLAPSIPRCLMAEPRKRPITQIQPDGAPLVEPTLKRISDIVSSEPRGKPKRQESFRRIQPSSIFKPPFSTEGEYRKLQQAEERPVYKPYRPQAPIQSALAGPQSLALAPLSPTPESKKIRIMLTPPSPNSTKPLTLRDGKSTSPISLNTPAPLVVRKKMSRPGKLYEVIRAKAEEKANSVSRAPPHVPDLRKVRKVTSLQYVGVPLHVIMRDMKIIAPVTERTTQDDR